MYETSASGYLPIRAIFFSNTAMCGYNAVDTM